MSDADTIKRLVSRAAPSSGNIPPDERKPQAQIDAAKHQLNQIISDNPAHAFSAMAENGAPGLNHFSIEQLKSLGDLATDTFIKALTDPAHRWYTYSAVIYYYALVDQSAAALDIIMQRLTTKIENRLAFPYRFYPMVGHALKQFEEKEVAEKIIDVLKNTSWFNRYIISMSLRNVCRNNPNRHYFDEGFHLLLDLAKNTDPDSAEADSIAKCVQQVNFALKGK